MLFWFAFPLWPRMLSISSCIYWPFVFLLLRTVCSVHLPIYSVGCWFFAELVFWVSSKFWLLFLVRCIAGKDFLPFCKLSLQSCDYFLCWAEAS
jgi:hypothetical protein